MGTELPKRILFVIDELDIGGTEQQILELTTRLNREKFVPFVCCFRKGHISQEIEAAGIPVFNLPKRTKTDLRFLLSLVRLMKQQRIDMVQTYLFTANVWGYAAAKLAQVPYVISSERNVDIWEKTYKRLLGKLLNRFSDAVIVNARAIERYLVGCGAKPDKVVTIPNGVNDRRFGLADPGQTRTELGIDSHTFVIGSVARLEPQKGHRVLLHGAKLIVDKGHDIRVLIIGSGPERRALESLSRSLGLSANVIFSGASRHVPELLGACDLSVLTSLKEGMPNALLESMMLGKPIVATNVGGNSELIIDGVTGLLVPANDPSSFAKACSEVIRDREFGRRLGQEAKRRVTREYSVTRMVEATEKLYISLFNGSIGKGRNLLRETVSGSLGC